MKRAGCLLLFFFLFADVASAATIAGENMLQPGAPVRIVGCSAEPMPRRNGNNVEEHASFEITGPTPATAVRVGFAYFDSLGGRTISNALMSGTFTPGVRIEMPQFVGHVGVETRDVVCFAMQASFADGSQWRATPNAYPRGPGQSAPRGEATIPTEIVPAADAPLRFDRCVMHGPENGLVTTEIVLTNSGERTVRRVDVGFVFYGTSGSVAGHHEWKSGAYPPGAAIAGSIRAAASDAAYAKVTCAVQRVTFADGTVWSASAGGATPSP